MNSCPRARGGATATHRARFPALWSLLLTGLVLALAPGAQAAPAPVPSPTPPEPAASAPFGVQAGLYGLTTLTGGHFGYALKAGARIEDSAVIYNRSDEARTFHVYGADVANAAGGGLAPAQEGQKMGAVGAWLKLDSGATVTVRPKSSATVRFSLAVPGGAAKTVESNTVRLSFFPWLLAALAVGGLLALGVLLVVTRERRRAWLRRRAEERTALRALRRELRAGSPPADDPHEARAGGGEHP
ncbi:hypothetical protein [Streptomyces sp. WAC01280]|uniref:hypothetical protein n=1 Tax=Streptomyces sp. WAC01280 TaxID=2487424 RepID=UPI000F7B9B10|nr:hypothetical protein [Streptomyces sp. WAC01280]RSS59681.1 hypothetical protein EF909_07385 [Streptomyces sp. WAC01280]